VMQLENLYFSYPNSEKNVLEDISFSIEYNEILVILGQSGCGKSTLFKNMLGLLKPGRGQIKIDGKKIDFENKIELKEYYKKIGVLFQSGALLNSLNLFENLILPLDENTALDRELSEIIVDLKLDWVELKDFKTHKPSELSGGMKKRAALARAIILDPEIVFLDEPHSGLDPLIIDEINKLILKIRDAFKMSLVVITHDVNSAMALADKILVLNSGKVHFYGDKNQFIEKINSDDYLNDFIKASHEHSRAFLL
jgi:phospholipid/cholesterol/gamma-HCH transport system ATP-binding protein